MNDQSVVTVFTVNGDSKPESLLGAKWTHGQEIFLRVSIFCK